MTARPISPVSQPGPALSEREQRLDLAIAAYLEAAGAGRPPDRSDFLARHSDLALELRSFFADEDRLKGLAGSLLPRQDNGGDGLSRDAMPGASHDFEIKAGTDFGEFELIEEIASGGMGVVFKARQKNLGRIVALKTIRPAALRTGTDAIHRFRIEAEAVARLDHPHIVPVYEMGEYDGFPFISLKLIGGGDLERHVPRLRHDPRAIARLMKEVARAVHYAHLRGILHRDLKPSNILLDEHGEPHVTDFGLAKCVENDSGLTHTGLILGTPSYMAPEQVSGHRGEVTTAADVYGLGAVLYKLLTGRPPFQAESVYETLRQVREQEPVPPGARSQRVDRDLEAICLKSLEKDPRRRYPSAEALAADLDRWLSGEPIVARPTGHLERAWRWCGRNRVVAGLSASVATLLVLVAAVATVAAFGQHVLAERAKAAASRATELASSERAARLLADARAEEIRRRMVRMNVDNGVRIVDQGDLTGALPWFAEALRLDRNDLAAATTHRLRLGTILTQCPILDGVFAHERMIQWATLDPSGRRLATGSADGTARIWDVATGAAVTPPLSHEGPVNWVEFQNDGTRLLSASDDGTIRIWDAALGRPSGGRWLSHASPVRVARFSPDGRRVVSGGFNGTVWLWDADTGTSCGRPLRLGSELFCITFSPDGQKVAIGTGDGRASVWRVTDGGLRMIGKLVHRATVRDVAFSPDGTRLLTSSHDGTARVWDVQTGSPITAELQHGGSLGARASWVFHAEFSPDGARVVTASHDGTARVWNAQTGRPITPALGPMGHSIAVRDACFSPDGGRIATAGFDGTARVWDAATGEPLSPPLYHGGVLQRARFTPDGSRVLTVGSDSTARLWNLTTVGSSAITVELASGANHAAFDPRVNRFATACGDGTARVWDAATGQPVTPLLRHRRGVLRVAFRGDGRLLATASFDSTARIWDAQSGAPVTPPLVHEDTVTWIVFSPDGSNLASASAGGTVRIWDVATGRLAAPPLKHDNEVFHLAYSPDGRMLASASKDGTARVWNPSTGASLMPPIRHDAEVSCVAFRPDGRALLTACSDGSFAAREAQQWEIETGRRLGPPFRHGDGVLWAAYSPDGSRLATASEDRTARVWDATTGIPVTPPLYHQHQVCSLDFSPDGRRLATCSQDGTARVWDATNGEPLSCPLPHRDKTKVGVVKFRPDGGAILTSGLDGTVRLWDLPLDDRSVDTLILEAQVRAGRRIDETGGAVSLSADELASEWANLQGDERKVAASATSNPLRLGWHRREARRLEENRQGRAAAWHLSRLAEIQPQDEAIALRLAAACEMSADWANVERAASLAITAGALEVENRVRRGWARVHLGKPAEAALDFRAALEREPGSAAFRLGLFLTVAERGELTDANALWRLVMDDHDEPRTDRWNTISTHLARLTESRPESWWLCRARGHVLMRLGHPDQSEADYEKAIHANPDDGWSWLGRGLALKSRNKGEAALLDFARSEALEPTVPAAWGASGEILGGLKRWDEAARAFDRWSALGGEPVAVAWYFHAALRLYASDEPGYRRACQAMLQRFGATRDPFVSSLVAHAATLGPDSGVDAARVVELAEQAARANPRDGWSLYTLGAALRRAGRLDEAVAKLDLAARVSPVWNGIPLVAAVRELTELARLVQPGHDPKFRRPINDKKSSGMDSIKLEKEIRKTNAAWQYQLEAHLLGRELDASASAKDPHTSRQAPPGRSLLALSVFTGATGAERSNMPEPKRGDGRLGMAPAPGDRSANRWRSLLQLK
jgi:WD40 repeat protein/tRNA A-37 threonylcarbamoyl transferase component Bud32